MDRFTRAVLGYWLAYVGIGWAVMLLGLVNGLRVATVGVVVLGAVALVGSWLLKGNGKLTREVWVGIAVVVGLCLISLPGALLPPTEGDSLAYHFTLPKLYAGQGGLVFAPVAVTFAAPQLTHMVSTAAYVLGGEMLMMLSAWLSVVMAGLAVLALARNFVPGWWSVVVAALFITTPCVTYGFAAGTVELRQAGMLAALALALMAYVPKKDWRWLVVVAALAGAQAASKLFGVFLLVPIGMALVWLWRKDWRLGVRHGLMAAAVVLVVGAPWYLSNWWHYGDPVFPMLAAHLPGVNWSREMQAVMERIYFDVERMVPHDVWHFITYPFVATFSGAILDSDRTGLGAFLLAGFAAKVAVLWGVGRVKKDKRWEMLAVLCALALVYYALWFFIGISGRSRHLLPVWPVLLIALGWVVYALWPRMHKFARVGVLVAVAGALGTQVAMAALLNKAPLMTLLGRQSVEEYLNVQAGSYKAAGLANVALTKDDKLLVVGLRNSLYYLEVPYFHNHFEYTQVIPLATGTSEEIWRAFEDQGFTAWLTSGNPLRPEDDWQDMGNRMLRELVTAGCLREVGYVADVFRPSRTLPQMGVLGRSYRLFKIAPESCSFAAMVAKLG